MATKKIYVDGKLISSNASSYNDLYALPSINGKTLQGEVTSDELGLYNKQQVDNLIASSKNIKIVPVLPSTPMPNTQYYVGPNDGGSYHIYIYDKDLNRIDLGGTDSIDFDLYQEKQPYHTKPDGTIVYDIGYNDDEGKDRVIASHSVVGAINEFDTIIQGKQPAQDDTLQTSAKTVVGAVNELNAKANSLTNNVQQYTMPWDNFGTVEWRWTPIASVTINEKDRSKLNGSVSANFIIAPNWGSTYGGIVRQHFNGPVHMHINVQADSTGFKCTTFKPIIAQWQVADNSCLRYNEDLGAPSIFVSWNNDQCTFWYKDYAKGGGRCHFSGKILVLDQDVSRQMILNWVPGTFKSSEPRLTNSLSYTWKQLGYVNIKYS